VGERGGGEGSEVGGVEDRVIIRMATHESPRTTRLYDRTNDHQMSLDEVERIVF
jgi:hypothetical protein